jgi:hypothetical protein
MRLVARSYLFMEKEGLLGVLGVLVVREILT